MYHFTLTYYEMLYNAISGGKEDSGSPVSMEEVEVKSKPNKSDDRLDWSSSRSSRSTTPTPAISIEPDGSLELTADMINSIDNEVITSDTLQSAKARGSNDTGLGVIIPSDDESIDGDVLLMEEEDDEPDSRQEGKQEDGGEGGEGVAAATCTTLPGNTPTRARAVSGTSEEESGHDHERTPQPSDHQDMKTTEQAEQSATDQQDSDHTASPTDNVSHFVSECGEASLLAVPWDGLSSLDIEVAVLHNCLLHCY